MAVELVLLSETPPTLELQQLVLGAIIRSGTVTQDGTEARAALHDPPETFTWWTDLVLLDQQNRTTMQVAVALASHVNGILRIRK